MRPNASEYSLAVSGNDFAQCHEFLRAQGRDEEWHLSRPTIMFKRDGHLLGIISRHPSEKMVIIGNLTVDKTLSRLGQAIAVIRLVEVMEGYLRTCGLKWYWACVDKRRPHFVQLIRRAFSVEPYSTDNDHIWYKREIV